MINVRLTVALPGSAQLYAMQCERADNDRAAGWVMRVERHRWSSHDTNICQAWVGQPAGW